MAGVGGGEGRAGGGAAGRGGGGLAEINEVTEAVIGAAIRVHRGLGPGLLESAYQKCLAHELLDAGIRFRRQHPIPLIYAGTPIGEAYRVDMLVEGTVLVEIKSVKALDPIHAAPMLTYLKLSGHRVGLLLNFNVHQLTLGLRASSSDPTPRTR